MVKKKAFFLFSFLWAVGVLSGQDKLKRALDSLKPQEKIHLLYDRATYSAGQKLWFSAFVFSGYEPSQISTSIFVELYDRRRTLIQRRRFPIFQGRAAGQLELPGNLQEDVYYIRAYTHWMLNFPEEFQYLHPVVVRNSNSPLSISVVASPWNISVFPEGGTLINGISTQLAIRLTSASPLPTNWTGFLLDQTRDTKIAEIKYLDPNVGVASFTPLAAHQYKVVVKDSSGRTQLVDLPFVSSSGFHLETHLSTDSIQYTIHGRNLPGSRNGYKVIGSVNGRMVYEAAIDQLDTLLIRSIPIASLPTGILRISFFNADDSLLGERLCFVRLNQAIPRPIKFSSKKLDNRPRYQSSFSFVADTGQSPYFVTVADLALNNPAHEDNVSSAMWLSQDISTPVEMPSRYFVSSDQEEALDGLLMTEKWKRFSWSDILHGSYPEIKYASDDYISVKGTAYRKNKTLAAQEITLIIRSRDSTSEFVQATTDQNGSFTLDHLLFYDSVRVFYQVNQKGRAAKNIEIKFETISEQAPYELPFPDVPLLLVPRDSSSLARRGKVIKNVTPGENGFKTLREVKTYGKIKSAAEKLENELCSPQFKGVHEVLFDFMNENQHADYYGNILEWLKAKVPGLEIKGDGAGNFVPYIRSSPVFVYLDEVPLKPQFLDDIGVTNIAMIKIIKGYFPGGAGAGGGGSVLIYTKRTTVSPGLTGLSSAFIHGYNEVDTYPMADYSDSSKNNAGRDQREVLFWNPLLVPEKDKREIEVRFYNNDKAPAVRIIVAGTATDGSSIFTDSIFQTGDTNPSK